MNETVIDVDNGSWHLTEGSYIYVDQEEMYIETMQIIRLLSEGTRQYTSSKSCLGSKVFNINTSIIRLNSEMISGLMVVYSEVEYG